jgi:glycosyltransferase involved in cell wall biosynthesis
MVERSVRSAAREDPRVALWVVGDESNTSFQPAPESNTIFQPAPESRAGFQPAPGEGRPITCFGYRDDMRSLYQAIDAVLLLPGVGSSGRVALEAMCAAKAIIAVTAESQEPRPVDCLRVPFDDEAALTKAILSLSNNRELVRRIGEAGRVYCSERHLIGHMIHGLKQIHDEVSARA